jgi:hypothetical protein
MATTDTLKAALLAEVETVYPVASFAVVNADLRVDVDAYCRAREAELILTQNHLASRSMAGQSFGYRDAGTAQRTAIALAAKLTRAGLSLNVGAATIADMRGVNEQSAL